MTKQEILIIAFNKGYRIDKDGNAISPLGNILKPRYKDRHTKYLTFCMRVGKRVYDIPYHRLVAYQKFGDLLFMSDCVRHLNGNSLDNSYDNIEIGSYSDNAFDKPKEERFAQAVKASPIKYYNVELIREYYSNVHSYKKTMEKFGISSKGTLFHILNLRVVLNEKDKIEMGKY